MSVAFHYEVRVKLIRRKENNELKFEEVTKSFVNESPIKAREEALKYYKIEFRCQIFDEYYRKVTEYIEAAIQKHLNPLIGKNLLGD